MWARAPSFTTFLDHTQRRTTVGITPLDEWSARRRDLYLTTHNRHTSIAQPSTWQHTTLTTDRHPCHWRDSNPQSQQGERPQTARPLGSATISYKCDKGQGKGHPLSWYEDKKRRAEVWLYSFFNLGSRWGWVVNITPDSSPTDDSHLTIVRESRWTPGRGPYRDSIPGSSCP